MGGVDHINELIYNLNKFNRQQTTSGEHLLVDL
jgi:hypothetical protein